jgi:hypothetical protein
MMSTTSATGVGDAVRVEVEVAVAVALEDIVAEDVEDEVIVADAVPVAVLVETDE